MNLLETRKRFNISQSYAANIADVPLRTYIRYETSPNYGDKYKRERIINSLNEAFEINEEKGILNIQSISEIVSSVFESEKYKDKINFCYLFGSYAKGYAKETSDIDLCIDTTLEGFSFFGLAEALKESLHKKIDLVNITNLSSGSELLKEIMKDGVKIYG